MSGFESNPPKWMLADVSACEQLAFSMAPERLASVATNLLESCCRAVAAPPEEVLSVIRIGKNKQDWGCGHDAFDAVRVLTLEAQRRKASPKNASYALLFVAENAAAVLYNATVPRDPFDADRGTSFLLCVADFLPMLPPPERERLQRELADLVESRLRSG